MEWAIAELCLKINLFETQDLQYIHNYDSFYPETKAWITCICDDLNVDDSWDFFMVIPEAVLEDANYFPFLDLLVDFVHIEIHQDIGLDHMGVKAPGDIEPYLQACEHRGDN